MYQDYRVAWTQLTAPGADFEVVTTNVRGVDIRTYANAPGSLRDLWLSTTQFADRDYLVYNDERLTYGEAHQRVASLANWLIDQGVEPGDRVAIAMRNYPEWMFCYMAITSIGAIVVPKAEVVGIVEVVCATTLGITETVDGKLDCEAPLCEGGGGASIACCCSTAEPSGVHGHEGSDCSQPASYHEASCQGSSVHEGSHPSSVHEV